jgi:thiol-disulfide isomerase/thioredoxin
MTRSFRSRPRRWLVGAILCLLPLCLAGSARGQEQASVKQAVISGTLLGHDGKPMLKGVAEVMRSEARPAGRGTKVEADGSFSLRVPDPGLHLLRLSGVFHRSAVLPIVLNEGDSVRVEVRLSTYQYLKTFDKISAVGDFNRFSYDNAAVLFKQPDGTYQARVKAVRDSAAYELIGVEKDGHGVPGSNAAFYGYDGQGDFMSVAPAPDSAATLIFDPRKVIESSDPLVVQFDPSHRDMDRYRANYEKGKTLFALYQRQYTYAQQLQAARLEKRGDAVPKFQRAIDSLEVEIKKADPDGLLDAARKTDDPMEKQLLIFERLRPIAFFPDEPEEKIMQLVEKELPPTSPWWSLDPDVLIQDLLTEGQRGFSKEYLQRALDGHPDGAVRAGALLCFLYRANRDRQKEEAQKVFERLTKDFGQYQAAAYAQALLNPNVKVREGEKVPDFSFVSLDQPGKRYTNADLKGKVYLLDFWATWCGPCVGEMPTLHSAYETYKPKGLEILSLSLDREPEKVATFRNGQWKMPWKNGFVEGGTDNPMAKAFEVSSIPKAVLVDETGTILAVGIKLRGWQLNRTLERVFKKR